LSFELQCIVSINFDFKSTYTMTDAEKPMKLGDVRPESQRTLTPSNASANPDASEVSPAKDEETAHQNDKKESENAQNNDPNAVGWDGPDDPKNPMNWSSARKWSNIGALSLMTLLT
jgi:hypothetical protein